MKQKKKSHYFNNRSENPTAFVFVYLFTFAKQQCWLADEAVAYLLFFCLNWKKLENNESEQKTMQGGCNKRTNMNTKTNKTKWKTFAKLQVPFSYRKS